MEAGEQEQVGDRVGVGEGKREGREPARERRKQGGRKDKRGRRIYGGYRLRPAPSNHDNIFLNLAMGLHQEVCSKFFNSSIYLTKMHSSSTMYHGEY